MSPSMKSVRVSSLLVVAVVALLGFSCVAWAEEAELALVDSLQHEDNYLTHDHVTYVDEMGVDGAMEEEEHLLSDDADSEIVQAVLLQLEEYETLQLELEDPKKRAQGATTQTSTNKGGATPNAKQSGAGRKLRVTAPASMRLAETEHKNKFSRFVAKQKRKYANANAAGAAYTRFKQNRARIVALNDKHVNKNVKGVQASFRSDGPFADWTHEDFKAKRINSQNPFKSQRQRRGADAKNTAVAAPAHGAPAVNPSKLQKKGGKKKRSVSLLEKTANQRVAIRSGKRVNQTPKAGAGTSGQLSGSSSTKSGKTGGDAGTSATKSGKTGGDSGTSSTKSGKTGGDSGTSSTKSGKTGGTDGGSSTKSGKTGGTGTTTPTTSSTTTDIYTLGKTMYKGPHDESRDLFWDPFYADDYKPVYSPAENFKGKYFINNVQLTPQSLVAQLTQAGVASTRVSATIAGLSKMGVVGIGIMNVRDQDDCGSCWAFSAAQAVWAMRNTYYSTGNFQPSPQQLVDCVSTKDTNGCKGGLPQDALDWMKTNEAANLDLYKINVPGKQGQCKPASTFPRVSIGVPGNLGIVSNGWQMVVDPCTSAHCTEQAAKEVAIFEYLQRTKLQVITWVDATTWKDYSSGLFPVAECSSDMEAGNHIVEIVGWGVDTNTDRGNPTYPNSPNPTGLPYWIVKNSWSSKWGEQGTVRLPFGINACGLANYVISAKIDPSAPGYKGGK